VRALRGAREESGHATHARSAGRARARRAAGSRALAILRLERDAGLDEHDDGVEVALAAGVVQQREPVAVAPSQVGRALDQRLQRLRVVVEEGSALVEACHWENGQTE
jgi:hypothetical protein